ncbi:MAG: DUF3108 domain-containing protein [Balneolaceae bacterium]
MKYWLLLFLLVPAFVSAQNPYPSEKMRPPTMEEIFSVKETFRYEVKYSFLRLGWVEVSILSDTLYDGSIKKHMFTDIRSNPKIPLVGTEIDQFHSLFYVNKDGLPVTSTYWKDNIDEGKYDEIRYNFDRENGVVTYREEDDTRDTLKLVEPATAGHIIFYFARLFAGSDSTTTMPVYVTKRSGEIIMENPSTKEIRNYAAFDEPIEAYMSSGRTHNIDGPFGFSGNFRAWFLADDLRVPLEARVKVFFGNAIVRLIEYKREEL